MSVAGKILGGTTRRAVLAGAGAAAAGLVLGTGVRPARAAVPPGARALFFGDSWTGGYSADPGKGYAFVAAAGLDWTPSFGPDGSGTGYVYAYQAWRGKYPDVAAALPATAADVVILQGSVNDLPGDLTRLPVAVENTVASLRWHTGQAPLVMFGPCTPVVPADPKLAQIDQILRTEAAKLGAPYVSPVAEGWINAGNVGDMIDPATGHPGTYGHAYVGARLAEALRGLITAGKL